MKSICPVATAPGSDVKHSLGKTIQRLKALAVANATRNPIAPDPGLERPG